MEEERRKVYVEVDVTHKTDGTARPRKIKFEDGEVYVRDELKPADIDAGGEQGTVSDINRDGIVG